MNEPYDWRSADRRIYALAAITFLVVIFTGFARSYYLKLAFGTLPLPSLLVHLHGLVMTIWVGFFIAQVWLIRTKNHKTHMQMGMLGIALAIVIITVGFFTGAAAVKYGSPSFPPDAEPLRFFAVPFFDMVVFAILFGAAIWRRKVPADHKRLMLVTVLNFMPPAIARIPTGTGNVASSFGIPVVLGVPIILGIGLLVYDTVQNRKLNKAFLFGLLVLIASEPLRIAISTTDVWIKFTSWVITWAA